MELADFERIKLCTLAASNVYAGVASVKGEVIETKKNKILDIALLPGVTF